MSIAGGTYAVARFELGEKDYGIRFFGIPSGYEFSTLIEAIALGAVS